MGGMNYQIEHHLFPAVANAHYPRIAPIVRRVCAEMGVHYDTKNSLVDVVCALIRNRAGPVGGWTRRVHVSSQLSTSGHPRRVVK
jgi:fatty acid desaturase